MLFEISLSTLIIIALLSLILGMVLGISLVSGLFRRPFL